MNIVETGSTESQLQEKETKVICTNAKENIEKEDTQPHENKNNKTNLRTDDIERCYTPSNDSQVGNDIQDSVNREDIDSEDYQSEFKNICFNGSCTKNEKRYISKDNSNRKITIVLNSMKGYEIKNKNNDAGDDNGQKDEKDDSIHREITVDSICDKSEDWEENYENEENGNKSSGNQENMDGAAENQETEERDHNTDGDDKDGEHLVVEHIGREEGENDEKEGDDEKNVSKKMSNRGENDVNGIGDNEDDDNSEDEDGDTGNDEEKDEPAVDGEDISLEFDNKYEGKTSQLPNFAVVYSFLNMFGALMDLPNISLLDLEQSIDSAIEFGGKGEPSILEMLHMKLLRKLSKSSRISGMANCSADRLNKIILKFCQAMDLDFTWKLQQFGYHILTSKQKLKVLKHLCEVQFDENPKFRHDFTELYKTDQSVLRLSPFGYEQDGSSVWLHEDTECNVHVYSMEDDDTCGDTWKVRVGCLDDMATYISKLKLQTEVNPKDIAAMRIKERRIAREEERQRKKVERDLRRKEVEEKRAKKKGRSTRRSRGKKKEEEPQSPIAVISETSEEEEDDGCARCYENKQTDIVLLCDGCDGAYHTLCLRPPVIDIPDDDWFCPFCLQVQLVQKLELKFIEIKNKIKRKEQKAKRLDFYGIRSDNIVDQPTDGRRLGRAAARRVDYNFTDYDQLISEAVSNYKKLPIQPRRELEEKVSDENGINDGNPEKAGRPRRNVTGIKKRRLDILSSDDYEESEGSEYVYSSSEEVKYNNEINVNEDIDEIEERYTRNKRLRSSGRNSANNHLRSCRRKCTRYEYDSDYGEESDNSSNNGRPQRRLRERKTDNMRNLYMYSEQFSDDEDNITVKEVDDGGEWADDNEEEEDVAEELESDEVSSNAECEPNEKLPPRHLRARAKRKRYVVSDDDSDEEVQCIGGSEEDDNNKIETENDSVVDEEPEGEKEAESDTDNKDDVNADDMERENENNNRGILKEDNYKVSNKLCMVDCPERQESIEPNEYTFDDPDDKLLREIKEEEKIAGINLNDENILKSGMLPPCFFSSLPKSKSTLPRNSPLRSSNDIPCEMKINQSNDTQSPNLNSHECLKELNSEGNKEKDTEEIEGKRDIPKDMVSSKIDETNNINTALVYQLSNKGKQDDILLKNVAVKDDLKSEVANDNLYNICSYQEGYVDSAGSNSFTEDLNTIDSPLCSSGNSTVTCSYPIDRVPDDNLRDMPGVLNDNSQDSFSKPITETVVTTSFHKPSPINKTSDSKYSDIQSAPRMYAAPSTFYSHPPPPYQPPNYSLYVPARMPLPPASHRGPLHPQHRLRAMAVALQSRGHSSSLGVCHLQLVPVCSPLRQSSTGPHRQQSLPPDTKHTPSAIHGPCQLPAPSLGPLNPLEPDVSPTHLPPVKTLPLLPTQHETIRYGTPPISDKIPVESRHVLPNNLPQTVSQPSVSLSVSHASPSNPLHPTHPSLRLPTHPSTRLRPPVTVSSDHSQTLCPRRPIPNYPYASNQPVTINRNWSGSRVPYDYYQQFQRPPGAPSSTYAGQPTWARNQPPPDWELLQHKGDPTPVGNGNTQDTSLQRMQSKEFKEHMKQLKEQAKHEKELAKQEKELKRLQKVREKELKRQNKRSFSPQPTPSNTPLGNMAYFKNMVIGGDNNSGGVESNPTGSSYPPFKASRM